MSKRRKVKENVAQLKRRSDGKRHRQLERMIAASGLTREQFLANLNPRGEAPRREPDEPRKDRVAALGTKCRATLISQSEAMEELNWLEQIDCSKWPEPDRARHRFVGQVLKAIVAGTRPGDISEPDGGVFRWPSTDAHPGNGKPARIEAEFLVGVLSTMGYRVGVNGLAPAIRYQILERTYRGQLPQSLPRDYLSEWGSPGTAHRLQKLANTIAALTRNMKRRSPGAAASDDWEEDLRMLKKRFYDGVYAFPWPHSD